MYSPDSQLSQFFSQLNNGSAMNLVVDNAKLPSRSTKSTAASSQHSSLERPALSTSRWEANGSSFSPSITACKKSKTVTRRQRRKSYESNNRSNSLLSLSLKMPKRSTSPPPSQRNFTVAIDDDCRKENKYSENNRERRCNSFEGLTSTTSVSRRNSTKTAASTTSLRIESALYFGSGSTRFSPTNTKRRTISILDDAIVVMTSQPGGAYTPMRLQRSL